MMRRLSSLVLLLAGTIGLFGILTPLAHAEEPYKVTKMVALPYFEKDGQWGQDLFRPGISLWNSIIGEGDIGGASSNTLVKVFVKGPKDSAKTPPNITLEAKTPKGVLVKKSTMVGLIDYKTGMTTVPLFLSGTGCQKITVTATLKGDKPVSKTIPFACGE